MHEVKDTRRATVRIGYDGRVHKTFRGPKAVARFHNEVRVLRHLEAAGCNFVPRLLAADPDALTIITTNCGQRIKQIGKERLAELYGELLKFGVRHEDPFERNITYRQADGRFCIIDFEFATIIKEGYETGLKPEDRIPGEVETHGGI